MAIRFPKNYNRNMLIRPIGESDYMLIAVGISSRGSNFSEDSETFYYMSGRGTGETVPTTQTVGYSYSGHRAVGDPVQDFAFDTVLYDLDKRDIEFLDYDDSIPSGGPNGWHGYATLSITDPGSGDSGARQNIEFSINLKGKPEKGTVTKDASTGKYVFTPITPVNPTNLEV